MPTFPTLRSGVVTRYPTSRQKIYQTKIESFTNGSEQRYISGPPLSSFVLQFSRTQQYDVNNIVNFFESQKGMGGAGFTLVYDGVTYSNCYFEQDAVELVEERSGSYSFQLKIKKVN